MTAALLAMFAGAAFGSLTVAMRFGLDRSTDPQLGTLAVAVVSVLVSVGGLAAPSVARSGIDLETLWPFLAVGLLAPGASQLFLTLAVRDAGPSRAAILMGVSPLLSVLIALTLLGEPFRPLLLVGTALIVFAASRSPANGHDPHSSASSAPASPSSAPAYSPHATTSSAQPRPTTAHHHCSPAQRPCSPPPRSSSCTS